MNRNPLPNRLPPWLRVKVGKAELSRGTRELVAAYGLHTVCQNARCPNIGECYSCGTATFMILGNACTRDCGFCAVQHGPPLPPDPDEPRRIARAAAELGLKYVVITSVTRDDLPDGGAAHFAASIQAIRKELPEALVEVLTPDFQGDEAALTEVLAARPDVFNHNLETVRRLQPTVRPQASYERSLEVLRRASRGSRALDEGRTGDSRREVLTKSGLMVGLGETDEELREAMRDLAQAGVRILTLGQYLQPTRRHLPVARYATPEEFEAFAAWGREEGIAQVFSGPFVRSSYRAAETAAELMRL